MKELDLQISALLDGVLAPAEEAELMAQLARDPAARERYADFISLHALLHWQAGRGLAAVPTEVARSRSRRPLAAAALVLLGLGAWLWIAAWSGAAPLARLTRSPGAVWHASTPLRVGDSLSAGQRLELRQGLAELQLVGGARVLLQGPAELRLRDVAQLELRSGRMTALIGAEERLLVATPQGEVEDLGTEFGVHVDPEAGHSSVCVFAGKVRVQPRAGASSQELGEAEGLRLHADGRQERDIAAEYRAFARSLPILEHHLPREAMRYPPFAWAGDGLGSWHEAGKWFGGVLPDPRASVRLSRRAQVRTTSPARAGEVFVGQATWQLHGTQARIEGLQGLLDLGFARSGARVELREAELVVAGRCVLRPHAVLDLEASQLRIGAELFFLGGDGRIRLGPGARLEAADLYGMQAADTLRFDLGPKGSGRLVLRRSAVLAGRLQIVATGTPPRRDIPLLEVLGDLPLQGRFDLAEGAVVHRFADGAELRLSYRGALAGDVTNDLCLRFFP